MKVAFTICVLLAVASALSFRPKVSVTSAPLQITVLTESLCPYCKAFLTGPFADFIKIDGFEKLANVTIIPFGNAKEQQSGDKYVYTCQHGENECVGNNIENCLQAHVEKKTAQAVIVCLETKIDIDQNWTNAVAACGSEAGIDLSSVMTCASSDEGMALTHQAALATDPTHQYVPWVIVNGVFDADVENQVTDDLITYACSLYTGTDVPACQKSTKLSANDDQVLQIAAFTESLCPYCIEFITGPFSDAINVKDIEKIANLTVVPYGNAKETQSGGHYVYSCQHGADECLGNAVLNCVLNQNEKAIAQKVMVCLESKRHAGTAWEAGLTACASEQQVDLSQVMTCANGPDGEKFTHQAAQNTDPAHKYVPWITVGGVHDDDTQSAIQDNLITYICANYKGSVKIDACATKKGRSYNRSWNF